MSTLLDAAELVVTGSASPLAFEREAGWERYLTLEGRRAYYLGNGCGTCDFVFRRLEGARSKVSPAQLRGTLRAGVARLEDGTLATVREAVPDARYRALLLELVPTLVRPGDDGDYFREEQIALWGIDPFWGLPHDPRTEYYRVGTRDLSDGARLFEFLVPMVPSRWLDPATVSAYVDRLAADERPTALAVSVLDVRQPADWEGEPDVFQHWCLAHYLLDGHHKASASACAGSPITLLSFLAVDEGLATAADVDRTLSALGG